MVLYITKATPKYGAAGEIRFFRPLNCKTKITFLGLKDGTYNFVTEFGDPNTFCNKIADREFKMKPSGDFSLTTAIREYRKIDAKLSRKRF